MAGAKQVPRQRAGDGYGSRYFKEFHLDNPSDIFLTIAAVIPTCEMLVLLDERAGGSYVPGRMMRASDLVDGLRRSPIIRIGRRAQQYGRNWSRPAVLSVSLLGRKGKWNL